MLVNPGPMPFAHPMQAQKLPMGMSPIQQPQQQILRPPENNLNRYMQYLADYSGCGHWRMIWPEQVINAHGLGVLQSTTVMNLDPRYYQGVKAIRIQRQATPHQLQFVKFLKQLKDQVGFRLIYEVDDIVFREDIPEYNKFKPAFEQDEIRKCSMEIMQMCDEVTVTCEFMRDYYRDKTGKREITIIPNFPPKFWIGNYYDQNRLNTLYEKNKNKPRILYAGSGAHFDVENRTGHRDDFEHVIDAIVKTRDKYQWVFVGGYPLPLKHYVASGDFEFHEWSTLYNYGQKIHDLGVQMAVAPLRDNTFNRAKSDIKYIESSAFGLPIACQDLCTYQDAPIKFKTGDEMIDQVDKVVSKAGKYKNMGPRLRKVAKERFLENDENVGCYLELFNTPYGSKDRINLAKWNKDV